MADLVKVAQASLDASTGMYAGQTRILSPVKHWAL